MSDLKACPFCGSKDVVGPNINSSYIKISWWIECLGCNCVVEKDGDKTAVVEMWNKRA